MLSLPKPIQAYFDANVHFDAEAMLTAFAPDAIVRDERSTHHGLDAIRQWIEQATVDNGAIATPMKIRSEMDCHHVKAHVGGNFPGSPVDLSFHFRLRKGHITELEIR